MILSYYVEKAIKIKGDEFILELLREIGIPTKKDSKAIELYNHTMDTFITVNLVCFLQIIIDTCKIYDIKEDKFYILLDFILPRILVFSYCYINIYNSNKKKGNIAIQRFDGFNGIGCSYNVSSLGKENK
jgi:hypothetical protein